MRFSVQHLIGLAEAAWTAGSEIDLDGIGYGRIHWGNKTDVKHEPSSYYKFLAGLASVSGSETALEIGTHWGGSTLSIKRGLERNSTDARVITIDITNESDNFIPRFADKNIIKIVGDANRQEVASEVFSMIPSVDFMYIDAAHTLLPTLINYAVYVTRLRPKLVVFDDINLNPEMRAFWEVVQSGFSEFSINVSDHIPEVRDGSCGFGILLFPKANRQLYRG
jgi:predicted O-methyltransferase YrrM